MKKLADTLHFVAVTLWVGGLWVIGYLVAPVLFASLEDRALAGALAGKLFTAIAYVGFACGAYLLLFRWMRFGLSSFKQGFFWVVVTMLALTAVGHFGVQPILATLKEQALPREVMNSVFRDRFAAWHGVSSVLYLIQSALGVMLVAGQGKALR